MIDRKDFIRPSSLSALELCPGRGLMEARALEICPEIGRIEHPAARQGTLGHAVAGQTLSLIFNGQGGWRETAECLNTMANAFEGLEPWSAEASRQYVNYAVSLVEKERAAGWDVRILIERHLAGAGLMIRRGGTADLIITCQKDPLGPVERVVVADAKLGFLYQGEAEDHLQLWAYAVMAWDKFSPEVREVEIHLAQGRRKEFSAARFDAKSIEGARARVKAAAMGAWAINPPIRPSLEACRYCRALVLCKKAREKIMDEIEKLELFGTTPEERVALAEMATMARRFAEEVKLLQAEWVKVAQDRESRRAA